MLICWIKARDISPNHIARPPRLAGVKAQIGYKRRPESYGGKPSLTVDNILMSLRTTGLG